MGGGGGGDGGTSVRLARRLGKAHARHHHKMFERRKQLAEFRYHDIRRQMLERAEWDAKADAEQAAAEEEIPDEGAKVEL